jgi:hypothetical protein
MVQGEEYVLQAVYCLESLIDGNDRCGTLSAQKSQDRYTSLQQE